MRSPSPQTRDAQPGAVPAATEARDATDAPGLLHVVDMAAETAMEIVAIVDTTQEDALDQTPKTTTAAPDNSERVYASAATRRATSASTAPTNLKESTKEDVETEVHPCITAGIEENLVTETTDLVSAVTTAETTIVSAAILASTAARRDSEEVDTTAAASRADAEAATTRETEAAARAVTEDTTGGLWVASAAVTEEVAIRRRARGADRRKDVAVTEAKKTSTSEEASNRRETIRSVMMNEVR